MIVSASFIEHFFLAAVALFVMMECALTIMHTRAAENGIDSIPEGFEHKLSLAGIRKAADYTGDLAQASLMLTVLGVLYALGMTYGHGLTIIASFTLTIFGPGLPAQWATVVLVLFTMSLVEFPFGWWARFRVKERYGYMRVPRKEWLRKTLLETGAGFLGVLPVLALLLVLFEYIGKYWWVLLWLVWNLYLFWRWYLARSESIFWQRRSRPYENDVVKAYIKKHLDNYGLEMLDMVVMTRPHTWSHSNVVLAGWGKKRTVVVFAHAVAQLKPTELLAAVAHEVGHIRYHHPLIRIASFSILGLLYCGLVGTASQDPAFFDGFGFSNYFISETPGVHAGYVISIGIITFSIFFYPFQPLFNWMSRMMQYAADKFAARVAGPDSVINMLVRLHHDRSQTLFSSRLYSLIHYDRPHAGMRVNVILDYAKKMQAQGLLPEMPFLKTQGRHRNHSNRRKPTDGQNAEKKAG